MNYWYAPIHAIVECEDCDWKTESYKNAQAIAKIHAKKYGHHVRGELGIAFSYNGHVSGVLEEEGQTKNLFPDKKLHQKTEGETKP